MGTQVHAESLLMMYHGKCWVSNSVGQFLQTPDTKPKEEVTSLMCCTRIHHILVTPYKHILADMNAAL